MERCAKWSELVHLIPDGRLHGEEEVAVRAHLAGCPACREVLAEVEELKLALRCLPRPPAPAGFAERLSQRQARSRRRQLFALTGSGVLAAAALLLLMVLWRDSSLPSSEEALVADRDEVTGAAGQEAGQREQDFGALPSEAQPVEAELQFPETPAAAPAEAAAILPPGLAWFEVEIGTPAGEIEEKLRSLGDRPELVAAHDGPALKQLLEPQAGAPQLELESGRKVQEEAPVSEGLVEESRDRRKEVAGEDKALEDPESRRLGALLEKRGEQAEVRWLRAPRARMPFLESVELEDQRRQADASKLEDALEFSTPAPSTRLVVVEGPREDVERWLASWFDPTLPRQDSASRSQPPVGQSRDRDRPAASRLRVVIVVEE